MSKNESYVTEELKKIASDKEVRKSWKKWLFAFSLFTVYSDIYNFFYLEYNESFIFLAGLRIIFLSIIWFSCFKRHGTFFCTLSIILLALSLTNFLDKQLIEILHPGYIINLIACFGFFMSTRTLREQNQSKRLLSRFFSNEIESTHFINRGLKILKEVD